MLVERGRGREEERERDRGRERERQRGEGIVVPCVYIWWVTPFRMTLTGIPLNSDMHRMNLSYTHTYTHIHSLTHSGYNTLVYMHFELNTCTHCSSCYMYCTCSV